MKKVTIICQFCNKKIIDKLIVSAAAKINGRKAVHKLTSEEASHLAKLKWAKWRKERNG